MDKNNNLEKIKIIEPPVETRFPSAIYQELVEAIMNELYSSKNPEETIAPYIYPVENIKKIADSDNIEYKEGIRTMANDLWSQDDWLNSILVYYILMHVVSYMPTDFYKLAYSLAKLKYKELAQKIIDIYEPLAANKKVCCHAIANFYYTALDKPLDAMKYFEKYLEFDPENPNIYNTLAHIYSRINDDVSIKKQKDALLKADKLKPNDPVITKSLLTFYEKQHDDTKIKELYPKLINLAPSPRHSMNYGLYLIGWGNFQEGGKYFVERFDMEEYPIGYPKGVLNLNNKWNFKDNISDKTLVIHYEEGFGDSIMYSRFIPLIKQYAKNTVLILQQELVNLFKQSPIISDGIEIFSNIKDFISVYKNKDYVHIPMMDLPYALGAESVFIPYTDKYINANKPNQYNKNKLNIGIAYSGDISANYNGRDVGLEKFYQIAELEKVQLYSLQVGESSLQLNSLPPDISIIDLGKTFKDFTDTANAISGLDLIITTDNVILNLAGALGKKTYGIFNKYPNFRWFDLKGDNVKWYNFVKPFQCKDENEWDLVFQEIKDTIQNKDLVNV